MSDKNDSLRQLDARLKAARAHIAVLLEDPDDHYKGLIPTAKWARGELWRQGWKADQIKDSHNKPFRPSQGKRIADPTGAAVAKLEPDGTVRINRHMRHKREEFEAAMAILEQGIPRQIERATRKMEKVLGIHRPRTEKEREHQEIEEHNDDLQARMVSAPVKDRYIRRAKANQAKEIAAGGGFGES